MRALIRAAQSVSRPRLVCVGASLALLALASACASDRVAEYRKNLTPEMATLGDTYPQIHNRSAEMVDTNWSLFLEDWARLGLWDRPSRLTPKPIPR